MLFIVPESFILLCLLFQTDAMLLLFIVYCCSPARIIRRYLFLYIPPGFWPRLVARLITFPKRTLPHYIKGNLEGKLEVWSEGIYYFWSEQAFFSVESHGGKSNVLDIVVPTTMVGTK